MSDDFLQDPALLHDFLVESEELLQGMDQDMVALESAPNDADLLNRIFRAMHTIKGTSGFLGFDPVVRLSHRAEDVLNALRRGQLKLTERSMDALLRARDQLGKMLQDIRDGKFGEYSLDPLLKQLEDVLKPEDSGLPKLGELLVANHAISAEALREALQEHLARADQKFDKLGDLLVRKHLISAGQLAEALDLQKRLVEAREGIHQPGQLVEKGLAAAQGAQPASPQDQPVESAAQTMRVDVRKLDELINLVGELALERNRLMRLSRDVSAGRLIGEELDSAFSQSTARLSFITEELQAAGLRTRMVPIDTVFRKFPHLVRDVAHNLHKEVQLVLRGEDTELDKTMVELIGDPLVHLVRNSLDHGIELPEVRVPAGKPRDGTIRLEAAQEGDQIVITVSDDGAGIDPDRILSKAIEKGLVSSDRARTLTKREILDFIFLPGFSTAQKVNDLSGRGVGMDVVRSNLRKLNGTVELDSEVGRGTTMRLHLPLTLAILPVLLVEVSGEIYALPLRAVLESIRLHSGKIHRVEGSEVLQLRGETVPLLRLRELFGLPAGGSESGQKVVILGIGGQRVALLVDKFIGQESTVIKPLGAYLHGSAQLAGATISGDGRVRLVLDPAGLLAAGSRRPPLSAGVGA